MDEVEWSDGGHCKHKGAPSGGFSGAGAGLQQTRWRRGGTVARPPPDPIAVARGARRRRRFDYFIDYWRLVKAKRQKKTLKSWIVGMTTAVDIYPMRRSRRCCDLERAPTHLQCPPRPGKAVRAAPEAKVPASSGSSSPGRIPPRGRKDVKDVEILGEVYDLARLLDGAFRQAVADSQQLELALPQRQLAVGLRLQATEGDCATARPSFFDWEARGQWEAWMALRGTGPGRAKEQFIALVEGVKAQLER